MQQRERDTTRFPAHRQTQQRVWLRLATGQ
jgi:hypothetical protein